MYFQWWSPVAVRTIGGKKLNETLSKIKKTRNAKLEVGFFPSSKYDDGMPVAQVAFWNEFGTKKMPERAFFRHGNILAAKQVVKIFNRDKISRGKETISRAKINKVGNMWVNELQLSIEGKGITYVANAPSTIQQKGSSQPLVDTSLMLASPNYKVNIR